MRWEIGGRIAAVFCCFFFFMHLFSVKVVGLYSFIGTAGISLYLYIDRFSNIWKPYLSLLYIYIYIYVCVWRKRKIKVIQKWWIYYEWKSPLKSFFFNEPLAGDFVVIVGRGRSSLLARNGCNVGVCVYVEWFPR